MICRQDDPSRQEPDPNPVGTLGDYELRHLVTHLAEARNDGALHQLLRLELHQPAGTGGSGNFENAWHAAQTGHGDFARYAEDVDRAWRRAIDASSAEARISAIAPSLGLEVRYALLRASLGARAHNLRPPLALALVQRGVWTFERGLAYARQLPQAARRVQALNGLAAFAPSPQRLLLLSEALAQAPDVEGNVKYALEFAPPPVTPSEVIAMLAPSLPESLLDEAFDFAMAADEMARADALVALAPHLPQALLDRALEAARSLDPVLQGLPLAALAPRMPWPVRATVVEEALARWWVLDSRNKERGRMLELLAPYLDEAASSPTLNTLLNRSLSEVAVAVSLARDRHRFEERDLVEVAHAALVRKAIQELDAARRKGDDHRAQLLAELAPNLPESLLPYALSLALEPTAEWDRHNAVIALASVLPPQLAFEAVAHVRTLSRPDTRASCLAALVPRLPIEAGRSVLDELLDEMPAIHGDDLFGKRADALAATAPHMTVQQLRRALALAERLADGDLRASTLAAMAKHLPPIERNEIFDNALAAARDGGPWALASMLAAFGPVPEGAASVTLTAAREYGEPAERAFALAQLAPSLTEPTKGEVLAEALRDAQESSPRTVVAAFAPIAPELSIEVFVAILDALATDEADVRELEVLAPHMPVELLPRALEVARAAPNVHSRAQALSALTPHIKAAGSDALEAVLSVDESWWPDALGKLAQHLSQELLERAWRACCGLPDGRGARALVAIAPYFEESQQPDALREVVSTVAALRTPGQRQEVLQALAPFYRGPTWVAALKAAKLQAHLTPPDRVSQMHRETEALRNARSPLDRARAARTLLEFELWLPPPVLAEAVDAYCSASDSQGGLRLRVDGLTKLAEPLASLSPDVLAPILSTALLKLGTSANERRQLLAEITALIPALAALGGPDGLREAARAIRDVGTWFP